MAEDKKYREISYAESAAKDNSIFTAWTRKWGIHVRPWYAMDKLKFSFVDVGKSGKGDSFDICMDIVKYGFPCFKKWVNDILSPTRRFEMILAQEAKEGEQYPKHYKYVTGNKGDKSIGICNSKNGGYVINASINKKGKRIIANIPVDFGDLMMLAQNFLDSYEERASYLTEIRKEAEINLAKYYEDPDNTSDKPVIADETMEDAKQIDESANKPQIKEEPKTDDDTLTQMKVSLSGLPEKLTGEFVFNAINKDTGSDIKLFVTNAVLTGEQKETWKNLSEALKTRRVAITFLVRTNDNKVMIEKIA